MDNRISARKEVGEEIKRSLSESELQNLLFLVPAYGIAFLADIILFGSLLIAYGIDKTFPPKDPK